MDPTGQPEQPHNIEAEQAVLGAVLLNNEVFDRVSMLVDADTFFDPVHGRIWGTAADLIQRGKLASPVTVKGYLADDEGLTQLGGPAYLARLADAVVSVVSATDYATELRELRARREVMRICDQTACAAASFDAERPIARILSDAEDALSEVQTGADQLERSCDFGDAITAAMERAEAAFKAGGVPRVSTGLRRLDDLLGGLHRTSHVVIAARTSMGKSALAHNIAQNVARPATDEAPGRGVCIVSLEMSGGEIASRMVSAHLHRSGLRVPYAAIDRGRVSRDELIETFHAGQDLEGLPIVTLDTGIHDLSRIRSEVRRAAKRMRARGTPLELVVLDYLQQIRVPNARTSVEAVSTAAVEAKRIAMELDCTVISVSQVNRNVERRENGNKRPSLADLRGSGEIEEAANAVLMVYRPVYYLERELEDATDPQERDEIEAAIREHRHTCEVIVEKNRGGPLGTAELWCDMATNRFEDEEPDPQNVIRLGRR